MRIAIVLLAACGGGAGEPERGYAPFPTEDHTLHGRTDDRSARYHGVGVSLADIPGASRWSNLPLRGTVDVAIELALADPRDYRTASGTLAVHCARCTIGDDTAKLVLASLHELAPDGVEFGHLAFDRIDARIDVDHGHVTPVRWVAESADVTVELGLGIELARRFADSQLDGCLRFRVEPALRARDPKTAAVLELTGAMRGEDGFEHIAIAGTIGSPRLLARACTDAPR